MCMIHNPLLENDHGRQQHDPCSLTRFNSVALACAIDALARRESIAAEVMQQRWFYEWRIMEDSDTSLLLSPAS